MRSDRRRAAVNDIAFLANSEARLTVLQALDTAPRSRQELAAATDIAPARLNRILDELEARDWIAEVDDTYRLTVLGTRVVDRFAAMLETLTVERRFRPVMPWFPTEEATFDITCLRDAEVVLPTAGDPDRPLRRAAALLGAGDRLHVMSDQVTPALLDGIWRATVQGEGALQAVITPGVIDTIRSDPELAAQFQDVLEAVETTISVSAEVALCVVVVDDTVGIVITDEEQIPRAVILCADERVHQWASNVIQTYREGADSLDPDAFIL